MAAQPGSVMPSASASAFMVEAVPMVLQWPIDGADDGGDVDEFLVVDAAGGQLLARLPDRHAGTGALALPPAVEHRAARQHDRRAVFTVAAAIRQAGVVLSQPVVSTTPSSG